MEWSLLGAVLLSSTAGTAVGFCLGLVPGLHVNNLAAVLVAGSGYVLGSFVVLDDFTGSDRTTLLVCVFLCAAMMGHMFSEAVVATYLGIPAGDAVSLLPAHRLARAGLGQLAICASADGTLSGAVLGMVLTVPVLLLLGPPMDLYLAIRPFLGLIVVVMSALLLAGDALRPGPSRGGALEALARLSRSCAVFLASGLVGTAVLLTGYFACGLPDLPWAGQPFVSRSSLLLPLFAGLFGVPMLLLSLGSRGEGPHVVDCPVVACEAVRPRDSILGVVGGLLVGWIPGMTSGSSAALCACAVGGLSEESRSTEGSVRFIWLYSAIASCGAVFSVGALVAIDRARSGVMEAVAGFMDGPQEASVVAVAASLLLGMLVAAVISRGLIECAGPMLETLRPVLCSRRTAAVSVAFLCALVIALTGTRGSLVLLASTSLGLLAPLYGVRRIHLMGSLLVPISISFMIG